MNRGVCVRVRASVSLKCGKMHTPCFSGLRGLAQYLGPPPGYFISFCLNNNTTHHVCPPPPSIPGPPHGRPSLIFKAPHPISISSSLPPLSLWRLSLFEAGSRLGADADGGGGRFQGELHAPGGTTQKSQILAHLEINRCSLACVRMCTRAPV